MTKIIKKISAPLLSLIFLLNMSSAGMAETTVSGEVQAIFNSLLFLICGFLVMFMAAGFAMLESGMVTSKSVSVICAKNIGLYPFLKNSLLNYDSYVKRSEVLLKECTLHLNTFHLERRYLQRKQQLHPAELI